jgi:predicted permease
LERSIRSIPGVTQVATANEVPFIPNVLFGAFVQVERGDRGTENPLVRIGVVNPEYWATVGTPVLAGRAFEAGDVAAAPKVAIINEALRERFYPDVDPIGRMIDDDGHHRRIVGVVSSTRMRGLTEPVEPELYVPMEQFPRRTRFVIVRASLPPALVIGQIREALATIDPTVPMADVATMDERFTRNLAPQRYRASLVGGLGSLALVLVTLGIYGVVAYGVSRRTREIGIRMALGERRGHVWSRVVYSSVEVTVVGVVLGVGLSFLVRRWLASVVVGVRPDDPGTLASVSLLLVVVAAAAAAIPAHRAMQVDPVTALRSD